MVAEATIHSIDIINHDTTAIEIYIESMVEQLYAALMKHLFQTAGEAAESVGNIIHQRDHKGNIPAGFLAMLEKIEFGTDRYGRAQRPTVHVAHSTGKELLDALQGQSIEYHIKVETLSEQKEKKAVALEAERISKFRWRPQ